MRAGSDQTRFLLRFRDDLKGKIPVAFITPIYIKIFHHITYTLNREDAFYLKSRPGNFCLQFIRVMKECVREICWVTGWVPVLPSFQVAQHNLLEYRVEAVSGCQPINGRCEP